MKNFSSSSRRLWSALLSLSVSSACVYAASLHAGDSPAEQLLALDRPLVIAHRGYSELAPENTLPSFQFARTAGADLVELDYYVTQDDVPVVFHDSTLDRTSDAIELWGEEGARIADKKLAELQQLDVGKWFGEGFTGTRISTLEEALDVIQKDGGVTLIERKEGAAEDIAALLSDRDLVNEVIVQAFDWEYLTELHERLPQQALGALGPPRTYEGKKLTTEERALDNKWVDRAKATGAQVIGWNKQVSSDVIAYAHRQGMEIWVYTINDAPTASWLMDIGVDGIITNNTSLIWRAVAVEATE